MHTIKPSFKQLSYVILAILMLAGCASSPPTQEMSNARQAVEAAREVGAGTHASQKMESAEQHLSTAKKELSEGDYDSAKEDAEAAHQEAIQARDQALIVQQEVGVEEENIAVVTSIVEPTAQNTVVEYQVEQGDSLWTIAAQFDVYNNAYQWPLIYLINSGEISDPDLIQPGQILQISMDPSKKAVESAISHAQERGVWEKGTLELEDKEYLTREQ